MEKYEKKISFTDDELDVLKTALITRQLTLRENIEVFNWDEPFDLRYRQRCAAEIDICEQLYKKILQSR